MPHHHYDSDDGDDDDADVGRHRDVARLAASCRRLWRGRARLVRDMSIAGRRRFGRFLQLLDRGAYPLLRSLACRGDGCVHMFLVLRVR